MTTTTRPVQADLGCVRRAISGTAARTTNVTSNAKIEPSSFMAVAHPPSHASRDRRSPLLFFRRAGRLGAAELAREVSLAADRHVQHRRPARPSLRVEVHELVDDWRLLGAEGRGHACRRFQLAAVPLTIGEGQRVRQESLIAGDRQRGRRVHAAREQDDGGLHLTRLAWHPRAGYEAVGNTESRGGGTPPPPRASARESLPDGSPRA